MRPALPGLVWVLPSKVRPRAQLIGGNVHVPAKQYCVRRHCMPHVPQLLLSVWRFAQYAAAPAGLHSVMPSEQASAHTPARHTGSPPTPLGHWRQFGPHCVIDVSDTQLPLQLCVPSGQEGTQLLPSQVTTPPGGTTHGLHDAPHVATEVSLTHWPSQSCVPRGHWQRAA